MNKRIKEKLKAAKDKPPVNKYHGGHTGSVKDPDRCPCGKWTRYSAQRRKHTCKGFTYPTI